MQLSRESILRMFDGTGGSGGSGGGTGSAQVASMLSNYISKSELAAMTWWGQALNNGVVSGSLTDVINITMTGTISINGFVIEYDSTNQALKFNGSIYATGAVSALGYSTGGGGSSTLTEPLSSINEAGLGAPSSSGVTLVWDGSSWTYGVTGGSGSGSVTSVGLSVPTGFAVSNTPITTSGTIALSFASGYSLPTTTKQSNWDTAYSWGNHASAGYTTNTGTVTSVAFAAPTGFAVTGSPVTESGTLTLKFASGYSLPTTTKQSQWDTAYGWGNHASAGYLQSSVLANYTWWGQHLSNGAVSGPISDVNFMEFTGVGSADGHGGYIDFHWNGSSSDYTSRIIENSSGNISLNYLLNVGYNSNVGISTSTPAYKLDVSGAIRTTDYIIIGGGKIGWDSTNSSLYIEKSDGTVANLYATGGISALGVGSDNSSASLTNLNVSGTATLSTLAATSASLSSLTVGSGSAISKMEWNGTYLQITIGSTTYNFEPV